MKKNKKTNKTNQKGRNFLHFYNEGLKNPSKTLYANIKFSTLDEPIKSLAVVSSGKDEGKTTVATNLACAIALSGKSVLLVDSDMRHRCIGKMLGIKEPNNGIYSLASKNTSIEETIYQTPIENLYFLDCEKDIISPPDLISSKIFKNLTKQLEQLFDYVIYDTSPILTFVDGALISNLVDAVIFVAREHKTKNSAIKDTLNQLKIAQANVLGSVITFSKDSSGDYYYAYYDKEGKRVNK